MINIWRPADGIGLNTGHREYLLDDDGQLLNFETEEQAREYLYSFGLSDDEADELNYEETEG